MNIQSLFSGRAKLLIFGVVAILLFVILLSAARFFLQKEPTVEAQRLAHLEYMVRLVEAYKQRHGTYPQPTARMESIEGIKHVWGYRADTPALASCTLVFGAENQPDPTASYCGGNVYDIDGQLIGWKGTLTPESGLNTIEIAHRGDSRVNAPLSELAGTLPLDPAYLPYAHLTAVGFGEYVYAVRVPEDGAQSKGGTEYQIAVTARDPETGIVSTHIRGNYFVVSEERDLLPGSLIGPGLLLDRFGNPFPGQDRPLHVLIDGQQKGYPHPVFGDGEETLELLKLRQQAQRLRSAIEDREELLADLPHSDALTVFASSLAQEHESLDTIIALFDREEGLAFPDPSSLSNQLSAVSVQLAEAGDTFLESKSAEVEHILELQVNNSAEAETILRDALARAEAAYDAVLHARDEILKYLDGSGIQEQSRSRAGRKLENALDQVPDLEALFAERDLPLPDAFLTKKVHEKIQELSAKEIVLEDSDDEDDEEEVVASVLDDVIDPAVMITTVISELVVHFAELEALLTQIMDDLRNASVPIEDIDESLRKLSGALGDENERIAALFADLADEETSKSLLELYQTMKESGDLSDALTKAAALSTQQGNFAPLLFSPSLLDAVVLDRRAGVPDLELYESELEATYSGVPYPLP